MPNTSQGGRSSRDLRKRFLTVGLALLAGVAACRDLLTSAPDAGDVFDGPVDGLSPSELAAFVRGDTRIEAVQGALVAVEDREGAEELEYLVEAAGTQRRIDGPDQGFCLFTAGIALQAALREDENAERTLRRVVGFGGDTDTNAAVAGALVGARDGLAGLPEPWLERLIDRDAIRAEAEALLPLAKRGR